MPYWPQLSYCLSFQTRIRAYLVKGKGLLLSKVPRDTAMRPLSRRGKRKRMDSQTGALPQSISTPQRESGSLPPCWVRSFTHRGVRIGAKNVRQRLRFTRALLESKDLFMWFCLPLYVWVSGHNPSSVETTPEQRSPRSAFPPCWEPGIIGGRKSKPPSGKKTQIRRGPVGQLRSLDFNF